MLSLALELRRFSYVSKNMFDGRVQFPSGYLESFCTRNHIRKLSVLGSALRSDFNAESDIDLLVEFEPGKTRGWDIVGMEMELNEVLGRPLRDQACLNRIKTGLCR